MQTRTKVILSLVAVGGLSYLGYVIYRKYTYDTIKEGTFTIDVIKNVDPSKVEVVPEDIAPQQLTDSKKGARWDYAADYISGNYENLDLIQFGNYE